MSELRKNSILYIIYTPGAGGNHLSNLLSLNDDFFKNNNWPTKMTSSETHEEYLLRRYKNIAGISSVYIRGINAHFTTFPTNDLNQFIEYKTDLLKIIAGHYAIIHNSKNGRVTNDTVNRVLLMTVPSEGHWINKRYLNHQFGDSDYPEKYTVEGFLNSNTLGRFTPENEWVSTIDPNKIISVNTDEFLKPTGVEYLEQLTGILLPESAKTMHLLYLSWFRKLKEG